MPASSVPIYCPNYTSVLFITCVFHYLFYTAAGEDFAGKEASSCPAMSYIFIFDIIYRNGCCVALCYGIYHSLFIIHLPQLFIEKNAMIIYLGGNRKISSLTAICAYH
jgi:hypothetical protein